jgi:hypothetical protein
MREIGDSFRTALFFAFYAFFAVALPSLIDQLASENG